MARTGHQCYFGTCRRMYEVLVGDYGFSPENVRLYSTQDYLDEYPDTVYGVSTRENLTAAYEWAQSVCTEDDLFYIYWVDHGSRSSFSIVDGSMSHEDLGELMEPIQAKIIIGAYNPCQSGCLIDDVSRPGVISITSTRCGTNNSFSWAENWWASIMKHPDGQQYVSRCPTTMKDTDIIADTDGDGVVNMLEGYHWTAEIGGSREGTRLDADGDDEGSDHETGAEEAGVAGTDANIAKHYSLSGWKSLESTSSVAASATTLTAPGNPQLSYARVGGGRAALTWYADQAARVSLSVYSLDGKCAVQLLREEHCGRGNHRTPVPVPPRGISVVELRLGNVRHRQLARPLTTARPSRAADTLRKSE
jgi:hypothetical protein